ncbi:hypothetical protein [Aquimarina amphilecti]|nr:hypothetical protein [Aquimarina amphilecti]
MIIVYISISLTSCRSKKSAYELSNSEYSRISNRNSSINIIGTYVSKDTLISIDENYKDEITTDLIKFNKNNTVQLSRSHSNYESSEKITNDNLTDWLDSKAEFYYIANKSRVTIKRYEGSVRNTPFWALGGPPVRPYKASVEFKIKGDTLIKKKRKLVRVDHKTYKMFKSMYILNKDLNKNHKSIKTDYKKVSY